MTMTTSEALKALAELVEAGGIAHYERALDVIRLRLEADRGHAELWRMCNGSHDIGEGQRIKCHVIVGVNMWDGVTWAGFEQLSSDELKAALVAALGDGNG